MSEPGFLGWISSGPIWSLVAVLTVLTVVAWRGARLLRKRFETAAALDESQTSHEETQEGYIVAALLGLLALLTSFTFALAVDRYEIRRKLVLDEANAIGTTYLRTQLLEEPHRSRISRDLLTYTENRIALASRPSQALLDRSDRLLDGLWRNTQAAFPTIRTQPLSISYLDAMNRLIDLDAERKTARRVRVPALVFVVLFGYFVATAGLLGYLLIDVRERVVGVCLLVLMSLSLFLIIDIDRPTSGGILESQGPMLALRASLVAQEAARAGAHDGARAGP